VNNGSWSPEVSVVAKKSPEERAGEIRKKNGGWQAIEAMREKAALKASLADVWDEDFDLDDEILADLEHSEEFFTSQKESEEEVFDEDDDSDEFYDEDDVD
jgi:hypothetical protein